MERTLNPIREQNLRTLRRLFNMRRSATKAELAAESGLSVVALQSLLAVLEERGEIRRDGVYRPDKGRPAAVYRYEERVRMALSVCMYEKNGEDTAVCSVCDLYGDVVETVELHLREPDVESFDGVIGQMITAYPAVCVVGFGIPGESVDGRMVASDYERLGGSDLCGHVRERFGVAAFIQNDINAAVAGYCARRKVAAEEIVAGIYLPKKYGPGVGVWVNGGLLCGRDGLVGEVACLPLGVDWKRPVSGEVRMDTLVRIAQTCIIMYNPHRLVIYGEVDAERAARMLKEAMCTPVERMMLPNIRWISDIRTDFEEGILRMGLNRILEY